jgi:hypothetical protein
MICEGEVARGLEGTHRGLIGFLSLNFPGITEKNYEKSPTVYSITELRFEPGIS